MKKKISIIGGGSCALLLACELDPGKYEVTVYEKNAAPGRKFLVAGEGGLNLTHSENEIAFLSRYTPSEFLKEAFLHFSNKQFISWINALGVETFVGSSGRVFPKRGIKPIEVLNVILEKIKKNKTEIKTKHLWQGFSKQGGLIFESGSILTEIKSDYAIFCLGGASWTVTGSAGDWVNYFVQKNITINPFFASNCAFKTNWPPAFISRAEGKVLKNISITCGNKIHLGEVVITRFGIEGSGIYPLSPEIRSGLNTSTTVGINIDFKPNVSQDQILKKLKSKPAKTNLTDYLKTALNLSETQTALLKCFLSKEEFLNTGTLTQNIKQFNLPITGLAPMEEAISTVGGVSLDEIDAYFQLKKLPDHFVIGEMLDYDAPTGGYLLQSCFSMAKYLADHLNALPA